MMRKRVLLVVALTFLLVLANGCSKSKTDFLTEISGVWKIRGGLLTLNYSEPKLDLLIDNRLIDLTVGQIDNTNKTININVKLKGTEQQAIWTIRQVFDDKEQKTFHLLFTLHDGTQEELSFVRKLSPEDINKIKNLYAAIEKQPAESKSIADAPAQKVESSPSGKEATKDKDVDVNSLKQNFADADKEINSAYKDLMKKLSPGVKAELKNEQIAWIKEKESKCNAETSDVNRLNCLIKMTTERTSQLKTYSTR